MFIQTEKTPNPETLKFIPGRPILKSGTAEFKTEEDAADAPLAQSLFKIGGVRSVFFATDFLSVTREEDEDWDLLKTHIMAVLMDHFTAGLPIVNDMAPAEGLTSAGREDETEIEKQIRELIEQRVQPAVAMDGGHIEFHEFDADSGVVYLEMKGACSGCPSASMTLKAGIENMLKHFIPEVTAVEPVEF